MFILCFGSLFSTQNLFLKKLVCPNSLIYYTTDVYYPSTPQWRIIFSIFFFYFHAPMFNCVNLLWPSAKISSFCENLFFVLENLFFFVKNVLNSSYLSESLLIYDHLWKFLFIYDHLWESFSTYFWLLQPSWK